ncbi:hypothetical protein Q669_01390 [Labrenzia sp. C1B10]|uniref:S8 family serine peptidase n=1 Tax=unclassified Labrenzia TaxID=2648686 RepID=UPI0003B92260|nr:MULTISPECIES: S8 family serine peptidase [unclassified Labrenzia]ERP93524.1 hypothetical protein Q669_01390 [Labrenzia sp. C1B10]ERS05651.1 hypothetical protein Q675_04535 [Labrenzia sp. C1B70]
MLLNWTKYPFDQRIDAYVDWTDLNGEKFPPGYEKYLVPVVFVVTNDSADTFRQQFLHRGTGTEGSSSWQKIIFPFLSPIFLGSDLFGDFQVFTGHVPLDTWQDLVKLLRADPEIDGDQQIIVGRPIPADAYCVASAEMRALEVAKAGTELKPQCSEELPVVVGVIDEGLAFGNERFRNSLTDSRVEFAWLQDGKCTPPGVPGFGYGRELTKWDRTDLPGIDTLLHRCLQGGLVDEDLFYTLTGVADFGREGHKAAAWRVSHGAHVMDLAAGYDMAEAKAKRHIISVQLPTSIVADTSGLGLEKFMIDGVVYIFDRAQKISKRYYDGTSLPVVINFSSGVRAGPHDGTSYVEHALDSLISGRRKKNIANGGAKPATQVVIPAGNSFQARSHVLFSLNKDRALAGNESHAVDWHVPPDDRTFSYVELWLPRDLTADEARRVTLSISAPGVEEFSPSLAADTTDPEGGSIALMDEENCNSLICKAYFQLVPVASPGTGGKSDASIKRGRFLIALAPTAFHEAEATLAPAGSWRIKVGSSGTKEIEIHGWIHWDDSPINYVRFGRQSYFEDPAYRRFASDGELEEDDNDETSVRRTGTINAIATGTEPKVVGGYRTADARATSYTSSDFKGRDRKPDYLAVSETSFAHLGILAAGTRSGSAVALNGTSVAAPQVTRLIADLMASGKTDAQIQKRLDDKAKADDDQLNRRSRRRDPNRLPGLKKERHGKGRFKLGQPRPSNGLRGEFGS